MRYARGGGLTAEGRRRRELVRLAVVEKFEHRAPTPEIAAELQVVKTGLKKIQYRPGLIDGCLTGTGSALNRTEPPS
jgi:hypothetical protein